MAFSVSGVLKAMETKRAGGIRKREKENLLLDPFNRSAIIQGS